MTPNKSNITAASGKSYALSITTFLPEKSLKKLNSLILACFLFQVNSFSQPAIFQFNPPAGNITTIIDTITCPGIKPGDIIHLSEGTYYQILIQNISGSTNNPVVLKNFMGQAIINGDTANYGISVRNSKFLNLSGDGMDSIFYGIKIAKVGRGGGLSLDKLSTDIKVSHIEISNTALSGLLAKSDPDCTFTSTRDKFTMYNIEIHDCYLHDIGMEGIYAGNSFYTGRTIKCDGKDTLVYPHVIEGIKVYNNIIQRAGRNGMQVNSAAKNCQIFNNRISHDSESGTPNQMGGIQIGGGGVCDCFNNHISDGKGSGIEIFGRGNMLIFNNLIEYPGRNYMPDTVHYAYPKHGIFLKDVATDTAAVINIFHNTIIFPKSDGILFTNKKLAGSRIQNNIIVNPGSYSEIGSNAFVHSMDVDLTVSHNVFELDMSKLHFADYLKGDYNPTANSPALDAGFDLQAEGIEFDFNYRIRPQGKGFDIGAFEYEPGNNGNEAPDHLLIFPNPFAEEVSITYYQQFSGNVTLEIYTITGQKVYDSIFYDKPAGVNTIWLKLKGIRSGIYTFRLITVERSYNEKIYLKK